MVEATNPHEGSLHHEGLGDRALDADRSLVHVRQAQILIGFHAPSAQDLLFVAANRFLETLIENQHFSFCIGLSLDSNLLVLHFRI